MSRKEGAGPLSAAGIVLLLCGAAFGSAIWGGRKWSYLKGRTSTLSAGDYSHFGVYDSSAVPRSVESSGFATDGRGEHWLFESDSLRANVWSWDEVDFRWTYRSATSSAVGVYEGDDRRPGARCCVTSWGQQDGGSGFIVFGGYGNGRDTDPNGEDEVADG